MRIRWRGLELPNRVVHDEPVSTPTYGRFSIEPFERGFGTTIGNSIRRVLLSSLEGAAVSSIKLLKAPHEFMALPGVLEDVTDIVLNIKGLVVRMEGDEARTMRISRRKRGEIKASDIECGSEIEIINPELHIATLTDDVSLDMEMTVTSGRGYLPATESRGAEQEIGVIPVDAVYSPILRVRYRTEDTRVGQRTNYDRLILEIWTRGTVTPEDALVEAARILRKHLNPFLEYDELGEETVSDIPTPQTVVSSVDTEMQGKLDQPVSVLDLSVRAANCLEGARIRTLGELVRMTEGDLLRLRSFGKTSLREVRRKLAGQGLSLGMSFGYEGGSDSGMGNSPAMMASGSPVHAM